MYIDVYACLSVSVSLSLSLAHMYIYVYVYICIHIEKGNKHIRNRTAQTTKETIKTFSFGLEPDLLLRNDVRHVGVALHFTNP